MSWVCPQHGTVRFVKPGISKKTGQPYPGFFVCGEKGCEERPPKEPTVQISQLRPVSPERDRATAALARKAVSPDWDRIAEGKCRSLLLSAWIQSGRPTVEFWNEDHAAMISYMMTGRVAGFDERWEPMDDGAPFPEA